MLKILQSLSKVALNFIVVNWSLFPNVVKLNKRWISCVTIDHCFISNTTFDHCFISNTTFDLTRHIVALVVAQLVERSLLVPEVRGSNALIGKCLFCQLFRKDEKEAGVAHLKNNECCNLIGGIE